jgi:hypothetical protein
MKGKLYISTREAGACTFGPDDIEGVSRPISITGRDENETKLNMPLFRLWIIMIFVQGDLIQPFNPFGENRP